MNGRIVRICTSFIDVPDEVAIAVYFAGCSIRCKGCQNAELWDSKVGKDFTLEGVVEKVMQHPMADYVVFLGGEPTDQMDFLVDLCSKLKIHKKQALYTGREFENLPNNLLESLDLIICGPYRQELYVGGWPASSNQRIFRKEKGVWKLQNA